MAAAAAVGAVGAVGAGRARAAVRAGAGARALGRWKRSTVAPRQGVIEI